MSRDLPRLLRFYFTLYQLIECSSRVSILIFVLQRDLNIISLEFFLNDLWWLILLPSLLKLLNVILKIGFLLRWFKQTRVVLKFLIWQGLAVWILFIRSSRGVLRFWVDNTKSRKVLSLSSNCDILMNIHVFLLKMCLDKVSWKACKVIIIRSYSVTLLIVFFYWSQVSLVHMHQWDVIILFIVKHSVNGKEFLFVFWFVALHLCIDLLNILLVFESYQLKLLRIHYSCL